MILIKSLWNAGYQSYDNQHCDWNAQQK